MTAPSPQRLRETESASGRMLSGLPEIGPPPPGAERRNWAKVSEAVDRPRRSWPWLLAVASASVFALAFWLTRDTDVGQVLAVGGDVTVGHSRAEVGARLANGAFATTGADGEALVELPAATALVLPDSSVSARQVGAGAALQLTRGQVVIHSDKRARGAELTVDALEYRVSVVGTVFSVELEGGAVAVRAARGTVHVTGPSVDVLLPAPATWSSAGVAPGNLTAEQQEAFEAMRQGRQLVRWPTLGAPREDDPDEDEPEDRVEQGAGADGGAALHKGTRREKKRRRGPGDVEAGLALYQEGQRLLSASRGKDAARAFAEYRDRFPKGPLIQEVRLSLVDALLMAHAYADAVAEADAFLAAFPQSERRASILLVKANVLREWGDCGRALVLYDELRTGARREAEAALFFSGVCLARSQEKARARTAFEQYLATFPRGRFASDAAEALKALP